MEDDFVVARAPERYAPAAHTLTEALLPTTFVVVNKPPALKHFPTIGLRPTVRKSFTRTAKSPQEVPAPRAASHTCHTAASGKFGENGGIHDNQPSEIRGWSMLRAHSSSRSPFGRTGQGNSRTAGSGLILDGWSRRSQHSHARERMRQ